MTIDLNECVLGVTLTVKALKKDIEMFVLPILAFIFFMAYMEIKTSIDNYIETNERNKRRR